MTITICDDDKKICAFFARKISAQYPKARINCLYDGESLLSMADAPDILLLDIQMKDIDGIALAHRLRGRGWETSIVFVTAYADYVFDAFDVGAFHYLVKPVSDDRLCEVLQKAAGQLKRDKTSEKAAIAAQKEKRITVKNGSSHTTIKSSDIIYAEVFNRKVAIHTLSENIEYYGKLKNLAQELGEGFFRPHRAYLVNLKYVVKYDRNVIFLRGGQALASAGNGLSGAEVLIAKNNYTDFVKAYMEYMKRECGGGRGR